MGLSVSGITRARARFQACVSVVVMALLLSIGIGVASPATAATPVSDPPLSGLEVTATGGKVLAGGTRTISVTGSNPSGVDLFNVVGVIVLPVGVTYAAGSVQPSSLGEPDIYTWTLEPVDPDDPQTAQVLVWSNVADLPVGSEFSASFGVVADPELYPAGATFEVGAGVYANSDERALPEVTVPPTGLPEVSDATEGGAADAAVLVVPITISKAETANAEAEVYRGPANPATFELTVTAARDAGTDDVVVVDDVPAQFTVTGCSGAFPCTREIVEVDGDVFTRITWDLGTVDPGTPVVLTYDAYVGEREITMPDGEQTGPDTRPGAEGYDVVNEATLTGTYDGDVAEGASTDVTVSDDTTVRVLDLGVVKTAEDGQFAGGQTKQYTLQVRSSQYVESSGITITDTIPDGMCPVLPVGVTKTGDAWPAECADAEAGTGTVTGATMTSVAFDESTGQFTVDFDVADLAADEDVTIQYAVYMRTEFQNGTPTATGDGFTNSVTIDGTTTDGEGTSSDATNGSSAGIGTGAPTLSKTIWPNAARTPITGITGAGTTCQAGEGEYTSPGRLSLPTYQLGDLVCFRIDAGFPSGVSTRSVNVSDYLPSGMSIVQWEATDDNTTTITPVSTTGANGRWTLGTPDADGVLFVAPGATASFYLLARVDTVPATTPRVTGNLAKMRYTTEGNRVVNLRDQADLRLSPPPPLALDKKVNGVDALTPVQEGQALTFTIDVEHTGTIAESNADPVDEIEVWDVLPAGFDCTDIETSDPEITIATDCVNNGDGTTRVLWNLDLSADPLRGGETTTITYTLIVPSPLSISSSHTNQAAVTRYTPLTTDGITPEANRATFYPTNPVGAYPGQTKNAPQAADTATIGLAGASVAKSVVSTSVTESNNDALTQATIGETVVWRYTATIPARTSIFNAILADGLPVPSRLSVGGTAVAATGPAGAVIADGCTRDADDFRLCTDASNAQFGSLIFPTTWTNDTAQPQTFTVEMTTRVADADANSHNAAITNTATLRSTPSTTNSGAVSRGTANARVTVVVPSPALAKAAATSASGPWVTNNSLLATGGQTLYYRLTATNAANRPPLHDTVIVDCIDARLTAFTNLSPGVASVAGPVAGSGTNGCAEGRDKYTWTLVADLATNAVITYSATVPDPIPAGTPFRNDATLNGSTLAGAVTGERTLTAIANQTVTAAPPTVVKTRTAPTGSAVPGDIVSWRVAVTVPAGVNLYQARILDTLGAPLGTAADATFVVTCGADWTGPCPTGTRLPAPSGTPQVLGVYLDDIAAAATARTLYLDVTSKVLTSTATTVLSTTNLARISWNTVDSTPPTTAVGGTSATADVTATVDIRHPLVSVSKAVSNPGVPKTQGDIFTYTVGASAVQNASPNGKPAYHVTVVDRVPAGVIPVVSATDGTPLANNATIAGGGVWDSSARTITWTIPSLTPGAAATTFSYYAKLDLASTLTGAALINTATPTSWQSLAADGKTYGPGAAVTASVTPAFPKVNATKSLLSSNPVYIGDEVAFSFTLTNAGTASAASLSAVDTLPANWTYVDGSAQLGGVALADPTELGQQLTWAGLGPLAPTQSLTITYRAVAGSSTAVGSAVPHVNTVTAANVTDATGGTSYNNGSGSYIGTSGQATARINQADLQVTKTAGTFTAGGTGSFTIVVRNNGDDAAEGVVLTDELTLPTGVTVTSFGGPSGTCTLDANGIECTRATLAVNATWTVTINLAIAAGVESGTKVPNTATVSSRTEDRNPDNDTSSATGEVVTSADLEVVKRVATPASGAVTAGEQIEWSITLTNNGPSVSRGSEANPIVLTDTLPADISDLALTGTVPDGCAITDRTLRCEITHDMTVGEAIVVNVSGTVDSDVEAGEDVISNTAAVTHVTTDPDGDNNSSTTTTDVDVREDLTIVKSITDPAPPADVVPGDAITYTLQVHNGGPSDARGVYIVDTLPDALTFDELVSGTGWTATADGTTVRFTYAGVVAAGDDAPLITYTAILDEAFTGGADELENTASVSSAWQADQDSDSATPGTPAPDADLALTKAVRPVSGDEGDPVIAGETAVYTFTVDNLGPSDADTVTVTDTLPAGLSIEDLPDACEAQGRVITCVLDGGLDVDDDPWTFDVTVRVDAAYTGTQLRNAAVVDSLTEDSNPLNNADVADLDVIQRADLHVVKVPSQGTVTAGENVTWTVTVSNDGPSDAQNVRLSDVVDPALVLVSATADDDSVSCTRAGTVTCLIGTLAANDEVQIELVTTVRSSVVDGTTIPNSATATSPTLDVDTDEPSTATDDAEIDVVAQAELTIVKTTTTPTVTAGDNATFRLAVGNDGPSDAAASVTVTDTLPTGLTFVTSSTIGGPAVWSCEATGQEVTCELQDADGDAVTLAAESDAPVLQIVAAVDPALAASTLTNSATAESPTDPTPPTDDVDIDVVTFADLGIVKVNVGTPTAGEDFSWTITVANHGPSDSVATEDDPIVVTDSLPDGTTFVSATGAGASCTAVGQDVTCEIADTLQPGDAVTVTLTVAVDEAVSGTITNTAFVAPGATDEPDGAVWPNESTVETPTVIEVADLAISKAVVTDADDIVAGQPITWELTVTNLGPSNSDADATRPIVVTDTLPEGVLADAASGPSDDWSCAIADDRTTVTCELSADLATDDPQTITVTGTIDPSVQGDITNTAVVAPGITPQPEDADANDEDTATSAVDESADLTLLKAVETQIVAGATGRYLLQVDNDGPSTARGVTITDTLPGVLSFVRVVPAEGETTSPWTCAPSDDDAQIVECSYDGVITPEDDPLDLVIEVSAASDLTGDVLNTATVASTTPDPDLDNNTDEVTGTLVTTADLVVTKSHEADAAAVAGEQFTWTVTVAGGGPSDSVATVDEPIVVTDVLAPGTSFAPDGSSDACTVDPDDAQRVVCLITETIAAGDAVEIPIRVALDESLAGQLDNAATAEPGATADPDTTNNTGTDTVTVTELADLAIAKEVATAAEDVIAGQEISWTVTVSNLGPSDSDATGDDPILVTDTLPAGVSFVGAAGDGWTCEPGDATADGRETVECARAATLAVGEAPVITVTGRIAPDVQGEVRNDVEVAPGLTDEPEDAAANNTANAVAPVAESADLAVYKAISKTIEAGAGGEYTLTVTNLGPSAARDVVLVDTLPEGLTFDSASGDGWTCTPDADDASDVGCTYDGILAPAQTLTLVIAVTADEALQGDIVNTAVVSASTPDPDLDNNTATATGTVAEQVDLSIVKTAAGDAVVGETFSYDLAVTNAGPATARGVRVDDLVPDSLEVVSVDADGWSCGTDASTGAVACTLAELASGAAAPVISVTVRVLPAAYPEVSNTATVSSTTPEDESTLEDNTSTATVAVPPLSDLAITKQLTDELVTGAQAHYTITVTNAGPTVDPGPITMTDPMPQGLVARGATLTDADGSCDVTAALITCTINSLVVGQAATVSVTVDVASTASGEIVNVASVSSVASDETVDASAAGVVTVVELPNTGGSLGLYLPFGLGLLGLGLLALWWSRRRREELAE